VCVSHSVIAGTKAIKGVADHHGMRESSLVDAAQEREIVAKNVGSRADANRGRARARYRLGFAQHVGPISAERA